MAKKGFNLKDLLNDKSKEQLDKKENIEKEVKTNKFEIKQIDISDIEPSKENFYNSEDVEYIKQSIELLGIEQNLIVKRYKDKYKLIAGHRRYFASKSLVEEGKDKYRSIPCRVKMDEDDLINKLTMVMTNSTTRELSDWEKMQQLLETEAIVIELKKESGIGGRTRDLLSEMLNISPSQLGRYKAINNNLRKELKDIFKENKITYSVAYKISGLSYIYQEEAIKILKSKKTISLQDVEELNKQEESMEQIKGQVNIEEIDFEESTVIEDAQGSAQNEYSEIEEQEDIENDELVEAQDADEEEEETEPEIGKEKRVVYVVEDNKKRGCTFCNENCNFTITTDEGGLIINLDPIDNKLRITSKDTGEVQQISPLHCLMCGSKL